AFHDACHANLLDDHCQLAQLTQSNSSTIPTVHHTILPSGLGFIDSPILINALPITFTYHFLIRAPPLHFIKFF
ncbi:MAG: hypothetical protein P8176_16105, partial [Gammaproteobacteria bacterium]